MTLKYEEMNIQDYDQIIILWNQAEGVGLSSADDRENIAAYLARNPGHSYVVSDKDTLVGAALAGHDRRRDYIHHLAVKESYRKKGIGKELANRCLDSLNNAGIQKCHLFVFTNNDQATGFWKKLGWIKRDDLGMMSKNL